MRCCGAYIGAIRDRQAIRPTAASDIRPLRPNHGCPSLPRFHQGEPFLKRMSRRRSGFQSQTSVNSACDSPQSNRGENFTMALSAPNLRRRPCYAKSGLLWLQRLRSARLHWRRHRLPPGMAAAGTAVVGIAAGVASACWSADRPMLAAMVTVVATCGGWSRRLGARAGV